jgi:hypothetical protein
VPLVAIFRRTCVICEMWPEVLMFPHALSRRLFVTFVLALSCALAACDEKSPTSPGAAAVVTFRVARETFRVRLTTAEQIAAAEAARAGGPARIPVGRIRAGADVNVGWSWHLENVGFAEATIEICDGLPSHVEAAGVSYANGQYCPWGAEITDIRRQ